MQTEHLKHIRQWAESHRMLDEAEHLLKLLDQIDASKDSLEAQALGVQLAEATIEIAASYGASPWDLFKPPQ